MKIFFNSSLPRSGSTLLQNIFAQNQDFYVTPTNGVLELLYSARAAFSTTPEFKAQDKKEVIQGFSGFCKGGLEGYFKNITNKKYVLDKSRGWGIHYDFLNSFYPNPKIICMVRDLRAILAYMEKIERSNSLIDYKNVDHGKMTGTTTIKRINERLNSPPIGLAMNRLFDIILQKIDQKILFVKYEDLCTSPEKIMNSIYDYLEIPKSHHNFNTVEQITKEDDEIYGVPRLHNINKKVEPQTSYYREILGEQASIDIYHTYKWFFEYFNYGK